MPGEVKVRISFSSGSRKIEYKPEISLGFVAKAIYICDWQLAGFDPIKGPIGQNIVLLPKYATQLSCLQSLLQF